ncbi:MAG: hypothetical protein JWP60_1849 [Ramlibacter sp.]|nr:hypothetical protein [Ramlibacter sp.]
MNISRSYGDRHLVLEKLAADRAMRPGASSSRGRAVHPRGIHQHLAMIQTYQRQGGLVSWDEAAMLLGRHRDQPISVLARWIVARDVLSFVWQTETLVPLFQFRIADMTLRGGAREVMAELAGAFDDLDLAAWFASPNCWLDNVAPVVVIETNQPAVLQAARADRYLVRS